MRSATLLAFGAVLSLLAACKSTPAGAGGGGGGTGGAGTGGAGTTTETPTTTETGTGGSSPGPRRIVAIGDLHGTLTAAQKALKLAGVMDDGGQWIGGDTTVVQTGDEIDRGDYDREIMDLFEKLRVEGHAVTLLGNHEQMNVEGDMRYVNAKANTAFDDVGGRVAAFAPGGAYARLMANWKIVAVLEGNVFVHGGVLPSHVTYGLDKLNNDARRWLLGEIDEPALLTADDGPTWLRSYSDATTAADCATLGQALDAIGAKRMVVGHTIQSKGINSYCDGRVWRIDVGMYTGKAPQVLQIVGDEVTILK